ncbi:MAG: acyltransferase family protein [Anaerolineales bacterium]|nr:acyltransferase family protein [Anaerolineales bacterium]
MSRLPYIDIAKGIGILLVALAHNGTAAYAPFLHHWIYSFHMPLFFFLSGLFFKPELSLPELLRRRFDSLLKPFFFGIFLIYFGAVFFDTMGIPVAWGRILKAMYGNGYYLDWVAMWFLPALFTVNLLAFLFYRVLGRTENHWLRWGALTGVLALGAWTADWFTPFQVNLLGRTLSLNGLPWSLDLALLAGFYFLLGREVFQHAPREWFGSPVLLVGAGALNLILNLLFPQTMDFNTRSYDMPVVFTLEAVSGILFVLAFSRQLERAPAWLGGFFSYMGRISVLILIFHNAVQSYLTPKLDYLFGTGIYTPLLVYPFSILVPVIIYELGVKPNPVVTKLFGMKS